MDNNNQESSGFSYTYSAREQAELRRIRDKYTPPTETESKLELLRRLDASVTRRAQAVALSLGILGALILGLGMSLIMTDLAKNLGIGSNTAMIVGITVGVVGGVLASLAYPVYNAVASAMRKKLAPEIIALADELMS